MFLPPATSAKAVAITGKPWKIKYKGHSIADVLELTVIQALDLFVNIPAIAERLHTLVGVGLGYLQLGQAARPFRVASRSV